MKNLVILGAGTGGTTLAHRLRKTLDERTWAITVVDQDDRHVYQPGLLLLPFGDYREADLVRPRQSLLPRTVDFRIQAIERIDAEARTVHLEGGDRLAYDVLVIATGCRTSPEATEGLTGHGWRSTATDFYTLEGSVALARMLDAFEGGRLVINIASMPIKCPVAPLELAFLADAYFTRRGIRDAVEILYATPLDGAFTKPVAARMLGDLLARKHVTLETDFVVASVDGESRRITSYDDRTLEYDLLVSVPLHYGAEPILASGLGDDMGFVPTDKHTLQSTAHESIFVLGDATNVPTSKAGSVAHFQSEVVHDNIVRYVEGRALQPDFDGHANCFIETGHDKAMLIDFNYDTEPLPGRYPLPGLGPFTLLEESHANHWGKLAAKWLYWNVLLDGTPIPLDHRMPKAGKWGLQ